MTVEHVLVQVAVAASGVVLSALVAARVSRWFPDRERRRGRVEAAVRTVSVGQRRGAGWRHGLVEPEPGHLTFLERGPLRFPRLSHDTLRLPATTLSPAEPIRSDARSRWVINPRLHVVRFESQGQVHELAARPSDLEFVRARLDGPAPAGSPDVPPT